MAREARDLSWASDMEERLQMYIEKTFEDAKIRNIDCRTTMCEIEVETMDTKISATFPYGNPLNKLLTRDTWMESKVGVDPESFVVIYKRG